MVSSFLNVSFRFMIKVFLDIFRGGYSFEVMSRDFGIGLENIFELWVFILGWVGFYC